MSNVKRQMIAAGLAVALCGAAFGSAEIAQAFRLVKGWNAIHVQVAETNDVDMLFKDWPVEWVALYDSAAFLETRQYSADASSEGTSSAGYRMWRRSEPGLSGFRHVPADSVLVCFATAERDVMLYGEPRAPRITWHKSSINENLNLVGFSTWGETTTARYFSGLSVGNASFFVFGGEDIGKPMVMPQTLVGEMTFADARVLAVSSTKVSDWSGVLNVSPRDGLDFGTEGTRTMLEIRNDGVTDTIVSVEMFNGSPRVATDIDPVPPGLFVRDSLTALTNGPWKAFTAGAASRLERTLAAGETWSLAFALDRSQLGAPAGTAYGAILDIRDETPDGSKMRVNVPVKATSDGGASSEYAWPKGVWLATAELDEVSFFLTKEGESVGDTEDIGVRPAGGKMSVRLPLYVDERGAMTLLQRFWYGRDTNGVLRAYSGAVETSDEPLTGVKRVSTAFLPADMPQLALGLTNYVSCVEVVTNYVDVTNDVGEVIEQKTNEVEVVRQMPVSSNVFGTYALAEFTVGEKSNVNPMRHAQHPRHDGLMADYLADAPSGDDLSNYMGTVKPEAFSVKNRIEFTWDRTQAASWNPEERLSGTLKWEFGGIRHEGAIQARGRFAMKRLSPVTMKLK